MNENIEFMSQPGPWDDEQLREYFRAINESGNDHNRLFTAAMVGNADGPHRGMTIHVIRGKPDGDVWPDGTRDGNGLTDQYEVVRRTLSAGTPANPPYYDGWPPLDIGPVEEAYFVLYDDCQPLDPPLQYKLPEEQWKGALTDEWNALMNKFYDQDFYGPIWQRRKLTFQQLCEKVAAMVVAAPDPDAKYHWYDRTD